jgi:uncharacterized phage infection (PIP) family protein YhgE
MRPLVSLLIVAALAGSACSSDDEPNTFCENRAELDGAIQDLRDVNVLDDGVEALDTQLEEVISDVDTLRDSAAELQPEVDAVKSSVESLRSSIDGADSVADKATALTAGITAVQDAWQALTDASGADCD